MRGKSPASWGRRWGHCRCAPNPNPHINPHINPSPEAAAASLDPKRVAADNPLCFAFSCRPQASQNVAQPVPLRIRALGEMARYEDVAPPPTRPRGHGSALLRRCGKIMARRRCAAVVALWRIRCSRVREALRRFILCLVKTAWHRWRASYLEQRRSHRRADVAATSQQAVALRVDAEGQESRDRPLHNNVLYPS